MKLVGYDLQRYSVFFLKQSQMRKVRFPLLPLILSVFPLSIFALRSVVAFAPFASSQSIVRAVSTHCMGKCSVGVALG